MISKKFKRKDLEVLQGMFVVKDSDWARHGISKLSEYDDNLEVTRLHRDQQIKNQCTGRMKNKPFRNGDECPLYNGEFESSSVGICKALNGCQKQRFYPILEHNFTQTEC